MSHSDELLKAVDQIREQRDRIYVELQDLGLDPFRSDSNFVLFGGLQDSAQAFEFLLAKGILVRDVGIPTTLRVTAGTEAETTAFLDAMSDFLADN